MRAIGVAMGYKVEQQRNSPFLLQLTDSDSFGLDYACLATRSPSIHSMREKEGVRIKEIFWTMKNSEKRKKGKLKGKPKEWTKERKKKEEIDR